MKNFDIQSIRADFPILKRKLNGHPLIYLDSAASAQRPNQVIDAESSFYKDKYAAIHRGIHTLSMDATNDIENIRLQTAKFINASSAEEIIFVKGTTEGINLVANSWGNSRLQSGDNIIITEMEHHANIVPWQMLAKRTGIKIQILPILKQGKLRLDLLKNLINNRTRLLAITHVSNVLGTINPIKKIISKAKSAGVVTLIDGAQAIMHNKIDVQDIDCDFYVFSGHKIYAPTGIGILYGRKNILDEMPPWEGGGAMIENVILPNGTTWNKVPWRFEAGTLNTGAIVGFGAALKYLQKVGLKNVYKRETQLIRYALNTLTSIPDLVIYGPKFRIGVISFNLGIHHSLDIGTFLDQYGIAIRTGHHCAIPLMRFYKVSSMCRASFAFYNTKEEIDHLGNTLLHIRLLLKKKTKIFL